MKRVALLLALLAASLAPPASAQQPGKLPKLAWMQTSPPTTPYFDGFREGMRELGYVDGRNIEIITRTARNDLDKLPALIRELVAEKPDLLFVSAEPGLRAAKEATATIPIVVVTCDALDSLVVSLARPGGKATGLTCISSDIASKRLQLLKDLLPALAKVAVLYNGAEPGKASEYRQMEPAAAALGLTLRAYPVRTADEMGPAFAAMAADGMQAVAILTDALMVVNEKRLAELAIERRLPSVFGFREYADQGGLMTYGTNLRDTFKRAASYVDKILHGADPASLPVEQPTKFQLVINQRAARALGITVPPPVLAVADDVLE